MAADQVSDDKGDVERNVGPQALLGRSSGVVWSRKAELPLVVWIQ